MAPKMLKDFTKEAKDLATKNVQAPGAWKVESKLKVPDQALFIQPKAEFGAKSSMSADIDFNSKQRNLKVKATVKAGDALVVVPKVTYNHGPHQVDVSLNKVAVDAEPEINYEFTSAKFAATDKLTKKGLDFAVAFAAHDLLTVGASATFAFKETNVTAWSVGARFTEKKTGAIVAVQTDALKKHTAAAFYPFKVADHKMKAAIQAELGKDNAVKAVAALEFPCPLGFFDSLRVKATQAGQKTSVALAFAKKCVGGWNVHATIDSADFAKVGLVMVRE